MTPLEFEQALDRWGTDLDDWPGDAATRARALLAEGAPAPRRSLEAATRVDVFLRELGNAADPVPAHLAARIVARAPERDRLQRGLDWLTGRRWRPAVLALVLAVGGFLTGSAVDDPVDAKLADAVMSLAFSDLYAEVNDVR